MKVLLGYFNWSNINLFWDSKFNGHHHHEYTSKEFNQVFVKTNFKITKFLMKKNRLNNFTFNSLNDLNTVQKTRASKKNFIYNLIQKISLLICYIFPQLRSGMILIAKKV